MKGPRRRIVILILLWASCAVPAFAQRYPYNIDTHRTRGNTLDQLSNPFDSIDPVSRNMHMEIPIVSLPPGPGGTTLGLSLQYDSHLYDMYPLQMTHDYIDAINGPTSIPVMAQAVQYNPAGGWRYGFSYTLQQEVRTLPDWESSCTVSGDGAQAYALEHKRLYRTRLTLPDGSQHILFLRGYNDELGDNYWGDGFHGIDITGKRGYCAAQDSSHYPTDYADNNLTYFTADGSYLKLNIHADASGALGTGNDWTLYFPDGRMVIGRGSSAYSIVDANGNVTHIYSYLDTNSLHFLTRLYDDYGRYILIDRDTTQSVVQQTITTSASSAQWTVTWASIGINSRTYPCEFGYITQLSMNVTGTCANTSESHLVVQSIQLPLAAASNPPTSWNSYEFGYESASGTGHLNYLRTPSGAEYNYQISGDEVTQKSITHDSLTDLTWTYTRITSGLPTGVKGTTFTAPDGGPTSYFYYNDENMNQWNRGLVFNIQGPLGTVAKRIWSQNLIDRLSAATTSKNPNNPYVSRETVSVSGAGGASTAVSNFAIDKNGNLRERKDFDWVAYQENATESGSVVLRDVKRTYWVNVSLANAASSDPNAYWQDHSSPSCGSELRRLNAVKREETLDGSNNIKTASEFVYDCPYTSGNVTEEKHWDSAKNPNAPATGGMSGTNSVILTRAYDSKGNLTDIYAPDVATHLTYGAVSGYSGPGPYPTSIQYAAGTSAARSWSYEWDYPSGNLLLKTDNNNSIETEYTYDLLGRSRFIIEPGLRRSETIYDDEHRQVRTKQDLNANEDGKLQTVTHYDQLGRPFMVRHSDGSALSTGPNSLDGIKIGTIYYTDQGSSRIYTSTPYRETSDATLEWTCTKKDQLGRIVNVGQFSGNSLPGTCTSTVSTRTGLSQIDYDVNRTRFTDPAGHARDEYRDGLGRLIQVVEDPGSSPHLNYSTSYAYDVLGNLHTTTQVDDNITQTRTFEYSSLGRLLSAQNPESGTIRYSYTNTGELASRTDAREITTSYAYDGLHRLISKSYSGDGGVTPNVAYAYYGTSGSAPDIGQLQSVSSFAATTTFSNYDSLGRALTNTQNVGGVDYTFNYTFRLNDSISTMQYPSGKTVTYAADDAGRASQISTSSRTYASNMLWAADGRVSRIKLGNDLWETREYHSPESPTLFRLGTTDGGYDKLKLQYGYSASLNNGNLLQQIVTQGSHSWTQNYTYDNLNRIKTAVETSGFNQSYDYDRFGNRWDTSNPGLNTYEPREPTAGSQFDKTTNRLQLGNPTYDNSGNLLNYDPHTLVYDAENRIIRASSTSNGNEWFTYDGDGRRVRKHWVPNGGSAQITTYVYGPNGQVAAEYSNQTSNSSGTSWMFADMLGSVRAVTGEKPQSGNASVTECYDYLPFGRMLSSSDNNRSGLCYPASPDSSLSSVESPKFTGQVRDVEIGLDYFGSRYMSPAQGRFASPDSPFADQHVGDPQSWNLYAYVRNNPLAFVDSDGHSGHHIVPRALWEKTDISPEARAIMKNFELDFEGHMWSEAHRRYNAVAEEIWNKYISENSGRLMRNGEKTLAKMTEKDAIAITQRFARDGRISQLLPELVDIAAQKAAEMTVRKDMGIAAEKLLLEKAATKSVAETGTKKTLGTLIGGAFGALLGELFFAEEMHAPNCPPGGCKVVPGVWPTPESREKVQKDR